MRDNVYFSLFYGVFILKFICNFVSQLFINLMLTLHFNLGYFIVSQNLLKIADKSFRINFVKSSQT